MPDRIDGAQFSDYWLNRDHLDKTFKATNSGARVRITCHQLADACKGKMFETEVDGVLSLLVDAINKGIPLMMGDTLSGPQCGFIVVSRDFHLNNTDNSTLNYSLDIK